MGWIDFRSMPWGAPWHFFGWAAGCLPVCVKSVARLYSVWIAQYLFVVELFRFL